MRRSYLAILLAPLLFPVSTGMAQDAEPQAQQQEPQSSNQGKVPPPQNPDQIVRPSETASTPSTARKILTNFWADQKGMWSSPFRMNRDDAKWWGTFGLGTAALIATDRTIENGLKNS